MIKVLTGAVTLLAPKYIINAIFVYGDYKGGLTALSVLLGTALFSGLLQAYISGRLIIANTVVYKKFRLELAERIMSVPFERTETEEFLDLKARAEQFVSAGGAGFGMMLENAFGIAGTAVSLFVYIGVLSQINFWLILLVLILTLVSIYLNYVLSKKNIEINLEKSTQERRSAYYSLITDNFRYGKEIRSNDAADWISSRFRNHLNLVQRFYEKMARLSIRYNCLILLLAVAQRAVTYLYLIRQSFTKGIAVGDFSVYLAAVESLSAGLKSLIGGVAELHQYNKYYEAFCEYYAAGDEEDPEAVLPMPDISKELVIEYHDVSFRYPHGEKNALSHISCCIRKGDIISIVGSNGAGKSTFIKLLLRLYKPTEGFISVNGTDIALIDRREYARCFACMFQDFQLFSFSLEDNILLGEDDLSGKAEKAAEFAGLKDRIASLEKGMQTMVYRDFDKEGFTPSGGEAQRLALARAVCRDSSVLILDEPTASLDPNIEYELNQKIRTQLYSNKTIINISHRLHSVRSSSCIFVLENGRLAESGTHEELFSKDTLYRSMFQKQAHDYIHGSIPYGVADASAQGAAPDDGERT